MKETERGVGKREKKEYLELFFDTSLGSLCLEVFSLFFGFGAYSIVEHLCLNCSWVERNDRDALFHVISCQHGRH